MTGDQAFWLAVMVVALVGGAYALVALHRQEQRLFFRRLRAGKQPSDVELWRITQALYRRYRQGRFLPQVMGELHTHLTSAHWFAINTLVCVDVARGDYQRALTWSAKCWGPVNPLVTLNEAEALACLGRLDEALTHPRPPDEAIGVSGDAAHRAWVLAELGRVSEAREALANATSDGLPDEYRAEWHFSEFAIGMAARDFDAAEAALTAARMRVKRASTQRNVPFLAGFGLATELTKRIAPGQQRRAALKAVLVTRALREEPHREAMVASGSSEQAHGRGNAARAMIHNHRHQRWLVRASRVRCPHDSLVSDGSRGALGCHRVLAQANSPATVGGRLHAQSNGRETVEG